VGAKDYLRFADNSLVERQTLTKMMVIIGDLQD
jgi:hypothetical protein